jgi:hypothetical protein
MGRHGVFGPLVRHLHGKGRVAEQRVVAVAERHVHRAFDQERLEARTIDEEIAFDHRALRRFQRRHVSVFRHAHLRDVGEHVPDAQLLAAVLL